MGATKRMLEAQNDAEALATHIALQAKAVNACPVHDDVVIGAFDDDASKLAYALGTNLWKKGEVPVSREEFMDAIKQVIDQADDECARCADFMAE